MNSRVIGWLQRVLPAQHATRILLAMIQLRHALTALRNIFRIRFVRRVVVDLDGVIFKDEHRQRWNRRWPQLAVGKKNRKNWKLEEDVLTVHGDAKVAKVLGEARIAAGMKPESDNNSREKLIRRALRAESLAIYNDPGYYLSLEPIRENVEQLKELLDRDDCEVVICTAVPDENITGKAEKEQRLREVLGDRYFNKIYNRTIIAGRKINKGDLFFHFIFEDNPALASYLGINAGLHLIVETEHNRTAKLRWNQRFVPHGTNWAAAMGLKPMLPGKLKRKAAAK